MSDAGNTAADALPAAAALSCAAVLVLPVAALTWPSAPIPAGSWLSAVLLGEPLTPTMALAGTLILAGVALNQQWGGKPVKEAAVK